MTLSIFIEFLTCFPTTSMNVQVQALTLYAISDQISRNSSCKYGVLVGTRSGNDIRVNDAFELETWTSINFSYLEKRLALLQAVSPRTSLVGLYTIGVEQLPDTILPQFQSKGMETPIYIAFQKDLSEFECYDSDKKKLQVSVVAEETEEIATSTIHSHYNYTKEEPELTQENEEGLVLSLKQLEKKMRVVLENPSNNAETDRQLVYLANKLANFQGKVSGDLYQLLSSHLSLLSNQLSAVNAAHAQANRRIATAEAKRLGKNIYMDL